MKLLVIGDKCTDVFVYGSVDRICPEAPVCVLKSDRQTENPGMAGNVYVNINKINKSFFKEKFDTELISNSNQIYKTRYVDEKSNQMLLRVDGHDYSDERFDPSILKENYDAIVVADYDKGFLTEEDLQLISEIAPYTFIDTKKNFGDWILGYSFIKINEKEWNETSNWKKVDEIKDSLSLFPQVRDLSGAGDTFMSAFSLWYLDKVNTTDYVEELIDSSIRFANQMASRVVSHQGVTTP
jgi:bifunctional ADP-heptose synthase (sugar kinase/adenylyltransferase)